jgi:peptidoglycan/LPS O-acetylase OafA/YrhL
MTEAVGGLGSSARTEHEPTRFPCFDGLRAVAALAVLVTHVAFVTGFNFRSSWGMFTARLDAGVAVFFLISGFLLYRPFIAARIAGVPHPRVGAYFWRRLLRIYPAYWLALTVTIFVFKYPPEVPDAKSLFLYYGLFHLYSLGNVVGPILSSYTLVTEIAFYVFLPIYAFAVGSRPASPRQHVRRDLLALAGLFAFGVVYRVVVTLADPRADRDFQLQNILPGWIDVFAVGMVLAVLSAWITHRRAPTPFGFSKPWGPAVSWALALGAFSLVSAIAGQPGPNLVYSIGEELAIHYLYLVVGVFLLLPAIFGAQDRGLIRGFLRHPVVAWLGLISYGLYLWNEALIEKFLEWTDRTAFNTSFGTMLLGVFAITTAIAAASYYVLERPLLRLKGRVPDRRQPASAARK